MCETSSCSSKHHQHWLVQLQGGGRGSEGLEVWRSEGLGTMHFLLQVHEKQAGSHVIGRTWTC